MAPVSDDVDQYTEAARPLVEGMEWKSDQDANREVVAGRMTLPVREAAQATKMTWNRREDYRSPRGERVRLDPTRRRGELDLRLPYIGPLFGFYVQNMHFFDNAGKRVRLDQIDEKRTIEKVMKDRGVKETVREEVYPRAACVVAMGIYRAAARSTDPLICSFGCDYVGRDTRDLVFHVARLHPEELAKEAAKETAKEAATRRPTGRPPLAARPPESQE